MATISKFPAAFTQQLKTNKMVTFCMNEVYNNILKYSDLFAQKYRSFELILHKKIANNRLIGKIGPQATSNLFVEFHLIFESFQCFASSWKPQKLYMILIRCSSHLLKFMQMCLKCKALKALKREVLRVKRQGILGFTHLQTNGVSLVSCQVKLCAW